MNIFDIIQYIVLCIGVGVFLSSALPPLKNALKDNYDGINIRSCQLLMTNGFCWTIGGIMNVLNGTDDVLTLVIIAVNFISFLEWGFIYIKALNNKQKVFSDFDKIEVV